MLSLPELGESIDERHTFDLLRVQTLDRYDVASDGDDFRRYLAGEAEPTASRKGRGSITYGRSSTPAAPGATCTFCSTPLSDYLRYACEWGYAYNVQAGQDVRIVEPAAADLVHELVTVGDFWVIDQKLVVRMQYDAGGRFVGADPVSDDYAACCSGRSPASCGARPSRSPAGGQGIRSTTARAEPPERCRQHGPGSAPTSCLNCWRGCATTPASLARTRRGARVTASPSRRCRAGSRDG